jgi:hypothetical protein
MNMYRAIFSTKYVNPRVTVTIDFYDTARLDLEMTA